MTNLKDHLKRKLRAWLGVDSDHANVVNYIQRVERRLAAAQKGGLDAHFRGNTQIVVLTRLGQSPGTVQIYDIDAKDMAEIHARCLNIMGPAWPDAVIDAPQAAYGYFCRETGTKRRRAPWR